MADDPTPTPDPKPDPKPDPEAAFKPVTSQEQFDDMVKDRINRERQKYADYDDIKSKAAKYDEAQAANQTDLEKAQERAAKAEREAAEATQRAQDSLLRSAIITEAVKKNVVDPDAVVAMLDRTAVTFNDDGSPKNIAEAMDSLLEAKPYLVGGGARQSGADLGARGGSGGDPADFDSAIRQRAHAR